MSDSEDDLKRQVEELKSQLQAEKSKSSREMRLQVSAKGGVSLYGIRRFPVTFYQEEWDKILGKADGTISCDGQKIGLAGLAGVVLSPLFPLQSFTYMLILLIAATAAVFGSLRSVPLAFAGGIVIGITVAEDVGILGFAQSHHDVGNAVGFAHLDEFFLQRHARRRDLHSRWPGPTGQEIPSP